jgi:predicted DNA-binding transcriptional regulator AlpA
MRISTAPRNQPAFDALYATGPAIAAELGISRSLLQLWIRFGEFPPADAQAGPALLWERSVVNPIIARLLAARANSLMDAAQSDPAVAA